MATFDQVVSKTVEAIEDQGYDPAELAVEWIANATRSDILTLDPRALDIFDAMGKGIALVLLDRGDAELVNQMTEVHNDLAFRFNEGYTL